MVAKVLLIINEASLNHFNFDKIHKYGLREDIFIQTLYMHTKSNSFIKVSPKLQQFFYASRPDFVFLLIQPSTEREFTNPEETYFLNITRICNQLPTIVHFLTPFKPKFSYLSRAHEKKFFEKLLAKESEFFKTFSNRSENKELEKHSCGNIIFAMCQHVRTHSLVPLSLSTYRPRAPRGE
jgi:hypothetical protein